MTLLQFTRVPGTPLYLESDAVVPGTGVAGFFVASLPAGPEETITPGRVWNDAAYNGMFVFLLAMPADPASLAAALQTALPPPSAPSFAWIGWDDAAKTISRKQVVALTASNDERVSVDRAAFRFGGYGFTLDAGRLVTPLPADEPQAFSINYPRAPGFPPPTTRGMQLPLYGENRFCIVDQGLLFDTSDARNTGFDAGFRYYAGPKNALERHHYPLFAASPAHRLIEMCWDPLGWQLPARTRYALLPATYALVTTGGRTPESSIALASPSAPMTSNFRTIFGEAVPLLPRTDLGDPAALLLEAVPANDGSIGDDFMLVPSGDFELQLDAPTRLLCGLAGTELIEVQPGDVLRFTPHEPAWSATGAPPLAADYQTSYAAVWRPSGDSPVYSAQPVSSPLFQPTASADGFLSFFAPPTAALTTLVTFPMVPYAGLAQSDAAAAAAFEQNVLAKARKNSMPAGGGFHTTGVIAAATTATTPQGFLATLDGGDWTKVLLAKSTTPEGAEQELSFENLGPELRDALQSHDLFLVVTAAEPLGTFHDTISIVGWPFTLAVGKDDATGGRANVLIFKFCSGTLAERAADPSKWSGDEALHPDAAAVSNWLLDYFSAAEQSALTDDRYSYFVDTVLGEPAWQGVVALSTEISIGAFPDDIKGLLGGIDLTRFRAHHFGINVSFIQGSSSLEMPPQTSLFGLIDYVAVNPPVPPVPAAPAPPPPDYAFRVLTLQVLFANSRITNFTSNLSLSIMQLFGDAVTVDGADPSSLNSIYLDGHYELQNGLPVYTFQSTSDYRFLTSNSAALNYGDFVKAQFQTYLPGREGATETHVVSRFTLWAYLNFKALPGLDILSFGDEGSSLSPNPTGLYCANLGIVLTFDINTATNTIANRVFTFDTGSVTFDLTLSTAREASLFRHFPLAVTGFDGGNASVSPANAGYLPVSTTLLQTASLGTEWYALVHGLSFGTMGALAANAGFTAAFVAAWSPGPSPSAALLIELPGSAPGKSEMSIQGVLRIGVQRIQFLTQTNDPSRYILQLDNIGLYFLGTKLPQAGTTDLVLFGNPSPQVAPGGNLAWYACYAPSSQ